MDYIYEYVPPPENMRKEPTHRAANFWAERIEHAACESVTWDKMEGAQIDWNEFRFAIKNTVREMLQWALTEVVTDVVTESGPKLSTDSSDAPTAPPTP